MKISKIEQEIALKHSLGKVIKIDESPNKNYFAPNTFITTILVSLVISAVLAVCIILLITFFLGSISFALYFWYRDIFEQVNLLLSKIPFLPHIFGILNFLMVLFVFFVKSGQKYGERVAIFDHGFSCVKPSVSQKDKLISHRYDEIVSIKLKCGTSTNFVAGIQTSYSCSLIYRYFLKNSKSRRYGDYDRQEDFSSYSRTLLKAVSNSIRSRLWSKIVNDIQIGKKEVHFGEFKVSKDYIGTIGNLGFYIPEIKEVKFYLSSEDDAFQVEPKPEFKKKWNKNWRQLGSSTVYIQNIDNPHLFLEVLEMLKVPVNLDALPELANIK